MPDSMIERQKQVIWKTQLPLLYNTVIMPADAEIVSMGLDPENVPAIWYITRGAEAGKINRSFAMVGTGHEFHDDFVSYISRYQVGSLEIHCIEYPA